MNKLSKLLAGLLLLAVAGALLAAFLVDPNSYKDDIETAFADAIGRELHIAGDLRISLFPKPALEIADASLPGAAGLGDGAFAELPLVRLYPRLGPLLAGRFELDLIHVEGLRLQLMRDEQGQPNWDLDSKPEPESEPDSESAPASASASESESRSPTLPREVGPSAPPALTHPSEPQGPSKVPPAAAVRTRTGALVIGRIEAIDASVTWDDRQTGRRLELGGLEISAGPVAAGEPVPVLLKGSVIDAQGASTPRVELTANLLPWGDSQVLRLKPLNVRIEGFDLGHGVTVGLEVQTDLEASLSVRRYLAEGLELNIRASGEALSGAQIDATVGARIELDLGTETLKVDELSIRSGALVAHGKAAGQTLLSTPRFAGDLTLDELDVRAWLEQTGLPAPRTADAAALRRLSLRTTWRLADGRLALEPLDLELDQTRITGNVERAATAPPSYRFDLVADGVDLDRYLRPASKPQPETAKSADPPTPTPGSESSPPPPTAGSEPAPTAGIPPAAKAAPLSEAAKASRSPWRAAGLDLDGRLRVGELKLARLRFGTADLRIGSKDGVLDLDTRSDRFYQGRLVGRLGLDLRGEEPMVSLVQRAEGIQTGPLLRDLTGDDKVTGRGDITADLAATGRNADALRRSLSGTAAMHVADGVVKGFNLERLIQEAQAQLRGKQTPDRLPNQTAFNDLRASAQVRDGVLSSRDLAVSADHLRVTGKGTVDLGRERFDYRFEPILVKPPKGQGIEELEDIPIPVRLTGTFAHPQWNVDVASALRAVAERELGKQDGGLFKKLEERTGIKGLEQGLRGLFGR